MPAAYVPSEGERHRAEAAVQAPKKRRGFISSLTGSSSAPESASDEPAAEKPMIEYTLEEEEYYEPSERERLLNLVKGAGLAVLLAGLISILWTPVLGILIAIMGGAVAAVAFYFGRQANGYDAYENEEVHRGGSTRRGARACARIFRHLGVVHFPCASRERQMSATCRVLTLSFCATFRRKLPAELSRDVDTIEEPTKRYRMISGWV